MSLSVFLFCFGPLCWKCSRPCLVVYSVWHTLTRTLGPWEHRDLIVSLPPPLNGCYNQQSGQEILTSVLLIKYVCSVIKDLLSDLLILSLFQESLCDFCKNVLCRSLLCSVNYFCILIHTTESTWLHYIAAKYIFEEFMFCFLFLMNYLVLNSVILISLYLM